MGTEQVMNMMPMAGITAFHGSPHKFSKFDMSKIGTGEGAQAYGHGLYFAEKQGVAKDYKERLSDLPNMIHYDGTPLIGLQADKKEALNQLERAMNIFRGPKVGGGQLGFDDAVGFVKNKFKDNPTATKFLNEAKESKVSWGSGNLYKVDIPDDQIAKMLDWDKPLSGQPKEIMDAVDRVLPKSKRDSLAMRGLFPRDDYTKFHEGKTISKPLGELTGKEIQVGLRSETRSAFGSDAQNYREALGDTDKFLKSVGGREKDSDRITSAVLRREGIPGIKYLDQGSRGKYHVQLKYKGEPYGEPVTLHAKNQVDDFVKEYQEKGFGAEVVDLGTSNFVLFDDQIPQILEINDKPVRGILSGQ
jgi:hypothetical protein